MNKTVLFFLKTVLFLILASECFAETITLGLRGDGAIVGWQCGAAGTSAAFAGATHMQRVDIDLSSLRVPDDLGIPLQRWNGAVEPRADVDIATERYTALAPQRIAAWKAWQDAAALQSADPSAVTIAAVEELHTKYEEAKARH